MDTTAPRPAPAALAPPQPALGRVEWAYLGFFFLSGLSGLVYEVLWTRLLTRHLGNTTYSVSTVLTAFMGGLALGSWLLGRVRRPLRWLAVYGVLELGIGAWCLLAPALVELTPVPLRAVYDSLVDHPAPFALLRFALAAGILLVPTTLMGATLPALARHFVVDAASFARRLGRLYAVNTLGAVAGALLCGFYLIPEFGQTAANRVAAGLNLLIGAAALALGARNRVAAAPVAPASSPSPAAAGEGRGEGRSEQPARPASPSPAAAGEGRGEGRSAPPTRPASPSPSAARAILAAIALSGAAAMIDQVVWNRILTSFIGSSTYAFTLLVSAFILGLALGSAALSRWADTRLDPAGAFGSLQGAIAAAALAVTLALGSLSGAFESLILSGADSFARLWAVQFFALFALFLVPTFAMGVTFPLAARVYAARGVEPGRAVGDVYALNTVGALAGSFLGGFVLIPLCGLRQSITCAVALNLAAGALCFLATSARRPALGRLLALGAVAAGTAVAALLPGWNPDAVDRAAFIAAAQRRDARTASPGAPPAAGAAAAVPAERDREADEVLFYREGVTATVSVHRHKRRILSLRINGKADASTAGDLPIQLLCGHLPMLFAPRIDRVLVIGLGSGVSLGATAAYPVQRIDCVELCPEVVEATRLHFTPYIRDACRDPRVRMLVNDGRNHVALTAERYDVISSMPTNLWVSGVASLFTREYFAECRARLNPEGVMAQWIQVYGLAVADLRSVLAAFRTVFPDCLLWELRPGGDYLLMGGLAPGAITPERLVERIHRPEVKADLLRMKLRDPLDVLGFLAAGPRGIERLAAGAPPSDDDSARLEFSAPRSLYAPTREEQIAAIDPVHASAVEILAGPGGSPSLFAAYEQRLNAIHAARRLVRRAFSSWARHDFDASYRDLEAALAQNPTDPVALDRITDLWVADAQHLAGAEGMPDEALALLTRALRLDPAAWELWNALGLVERQKGDHALSERAFEEATRAAPWAPEAWINRGAAAETLRGPAAAESQFREAVRLAPDLGVARHFLGRALAAQGKTGAGAAELELAVRYLPDALDVRIDLANLYVKLGRADLARPHVAAAERLRRGRN
ncbi:MAG: fused MFS/spermidine synthase [Planctomycetes bacterium]|nr:fused MFS/spermidine synthase [Planctomycetota bacterium]